MGGGKQRMWLQKLLIFVCNFAVLVCISLQEEFAAFNGPYLMLTESGEFCGVGGGGGGKEM